MFSRDLNFESIRLTIELKRICIPLITKEEIAPYDENVIPLAGRTSLSWGRIFAIAAAIFGYQVAYTIEFAISTPMMTKFNLSSLSKGLIWIAGPLSGLFVQPLVGYYSDICKALLGRRRPFIIAGCVATLVGFGLLMSMDYIAKAVGENPQKEVILATLMFFILLIINSAINVFQSPARALLGDLTPQAQQIFANSIASGLIALASIVSNICSYLTTKISIKGPLTIDHIIVIVNMVLMIICVVITLIAAREEPLTENPAREPPFKQIFIAIKNMKPEISRVALVYFFSWIAYFPFQVTCTDYFGDLYEKHGMDRIDGNAFGMLVLAVSNALVLPLSPFQDRVIRRIGLRLSYMIAEGITALCLVLIFATENIYGLMAIFAPLSISMLITNSVPFALVGMYCAEEQTAVYMGVLNIAAVIGQQLANLALISGLGSINTTLSNRIVIGSGSLFALIAAGLCFLIEKPEDVSIPDQNLIESDFLK